MKIRILIFVGIWWLLFWGYWTLLVCGFAGESPTRAIFLQHCFTSLFIFLLVGLGPIVLTILKMRER